VDALLVTVVALVPPVLTVPPVVLPAELLRPPEVEMPPELGGTVVAPAPARLLELGGAELPAAPAPPEVFVPELELPPAPGWLAEAPPDAL
jgi:hypothetical protein